MVKVTSRRPIGEVELGFGNDNVGLQSIHSGGAMAIYLSGVLEIIIKRIDCWKSDTYLEYIREQVESFTVGVSEKKLENENFHHLNEKENTMLESNQETSEEDGVDHVPVTAHFAEGIVKDMADLSFGEE